MFKYATLFFALYVASSALLSSDSSEEDTSTDESSSDFCDENSPDDLVMALADRSHQFSYLKLNQDLWEFTVKRFDKVHGLPSFDAKLRALKLLSPEDQEFFEQHILDKFTRFYPEDLIIALALRAALFSSLEIGGEDWRYVTERFNTRYGFPRAANLQIALRGMMNREARNFMERHVVTREAMDHADYRVRALAKCAAPYQHLVDEEEWKDEVKEFNYMIGNPSPKAKSEALKSLASDRRKFFDRNIVSKIVVTLRGKENENPEQNIVVCQRLTGEHFRRWELQKKRVRRQGK